MVAAGGRARPRPDVPLAALPGRARVDARAHVHGRATRSWARAAAPGTWRCATASGCGDQRRPPRAPTPPRPCACRCDTYSAMAAGAMTPTEAMQQQLTRIEGEIYPVTLLGRWIDRARGRDDAGADARARQRERSVARVGTWRAGARVPRRATPAPARRGTASELLGYRELYALWERQNWRAHELDFTRGPASSGWPPRPRRRRTRSGASARFYIGEERVTADLAPFVLAAPERRDRDLPRHAARGRGAPRRVLRPLRRRGDGAGRPTTFAAACARWSRRSPRRGATVFDDGLRDIAERIKPRPGRPRAVRGGHHDLPHGGRGRSWR